MALISIHSRITTIAELTATTISRTTHRISHLSKKIQCKRDMDVGGGGGTRTHTRFPVTGFLDRGSANYAYSSICGQYLLCASPCPGSPVFCHGPAALPLREAK